MWIYLQGPEDQPVVGQGDLGEHGLRWKAHGLKRKRPVVRPGPIYELYVFGKGKELKQHWRPQQQSGLLMLDWSTSVSDRTVPRLHDPDYVVLLRIRFRVVNDGLFPKLLRWGLESRQASELSNFLHIPIHVKVSPRKLAIVVTSLAGAQLFSHFYGQVMKWVSNQSKAGWHELLVALPVTFLFGVLTFGLLYVVLEFFWNARE